MDQLVLKICQITLNDLNNMSEVTLNDDKMAHNHMKTHTYSIAYHPNQVQVLQTFFLKLPQAKCWVDSLIPHLIIQVSFL